MVAALTLLALLSSEPVKSRLVVLDLKGRGVSADLAASINDALLRECCRYGLNYDRVVESYRGEVSQEQGNQRAGRAWWDYAIVAGAVGVFVYLGVNATVPALGMDFTWLRVLVAVLVAAALGGGWGLWKVTRFS